MTGDGLRVRGYGYGLRVTGYGLRVRVRVRAGVGVSYRNRCSKRARPRLGDMAHLPRLAAEPAPRTHNRCERHVQKVFLAGVTTLEGVTSRCS